MFEGQRHTFWLRRAANHPAIEESCRFLIRREGRFAKNTVGWVLRAMAKHAHGFVRRLIEENIDHLSFESLSNAARHFDKGDLKAY